MGAAHISITDAIVEVRGSYQGPGEYLNHELAVLHVETVQGVGLALHFDSLAGLELFVRQVRRAEEQIQNKARKSA